MLISRRNIFLLSLALIALWCSQAQADPHNAIISRQTQDTTNETDLVHFDEGEEHHDDEGEEHHDDEGEEHHDDEGEEHHDDEDHDSHDELLIETAESRSNKPWGEVIVASLLINLVTLIGIAFIAGDFLAKSFYKHDGTSSSSKAKRDWKFASNMIPSFACGALLATNAFLILPESLVMIASFFSEDDHEGEHRLLEEEHDDHEDGTESAVAWRFGISLLGGFLLPVITSFFFPKFHEPELSEVCIEATSIELESKMLEPFSKKDDGSIHEDADDTDADCRNDEEAATEAEPITVACDDKKPLAPSISHINYSLASSILLGDFFHNFTDGVFVGTAFLLCDRKLAITISIATIYHELAQEIADFFLLTKHCNIRPAMALFLNFLCGLSVLFGAILILSVDISSNTTGCILAIGGGVYFYVAVGECMPRAREAQTTVDDKALSLISFVVGAVPIGLVLLNHGHCEAH